MENMGSKIQKVREIRNVSQKFVANHLGVSQTTISNIESGKTEIEEEKLKKIAEAMDVDPEVIKNFNEKMVFNACVQSG